ncbi:MAG: RIP metalloprotease RseP [Candidatus Eisenbacteria bacterium]|nr:RIP metalloprotease RseP [Candidatus Eisenbacteria bacterium]
MLIFYILAAVLIGILIIVHELGHFAAARASGVTVERFSIGFGRKLVSIKRGDTEYVISLVPLGGYVKMAGTDVSEHPVGESPGPDTFPGKPVGLRAVIVAAGPLANVLWAFLVYVGIVWIGGATVFGVDAPVVGYVTEESPAAEAGVAVLDTILSVEGQPVESWTELKRGITSADTEDGVSLEIARPGEEGTLSLVLDARPDSATGEVTIGVAGYVPALVGNVMKGSPADQAGLRKGDRVTAVGGRRVRSWFELSALVSESAGSERTISWEREGETISASIATDDPGRDVEPTDLAALGEMVGITPSFEVEDVGFGEALASAGGYVVFMTREIGRVFWLMVTQRISMDIIGGPIRVVQMASDSARWGASSFFGFMAYLSLNLAIINLLPLPILDGGHLLLLGLERVRRKSLSERALLIWQQVGLIFFIGLALFLLLRDLLLLR